MAHTRSRSATQKNRSSRRFKNILQLFKKNVTTPPGTHREPVTRGSDVYRTPRSVPTAPTPPRTRIMMGLIVCNANLIRFDAKRHNGRSYGLTRPYRHMHRCGETHPATTTTTATQLHVRGHMHDPCARPVPLPGWEAAAAVARLAERLGQARQSLRRS